MSTSLAPPPAATAVTPTLQHAAGRAADYARAAHAANTRRAYQADWRDFAQWCDATGQAALPAAPATVGSYLADRAATRATATVARRLAAISTAHRLAGHHLDTRHPAIRTVMQGIRRTHGTAPRKATPLRTSALKDLLDTCGTTRLIDRRDRALLLLGLASALRRSELAALTVADLGFVDGGREARPSRAARPTRRRPVRSSAWSPPAPRPAPWRRCGRGWRPPASPRARCSARSIATAGSPPACPTGPSR